MELHEIPNNWVKTDTHGNGRGLTQRLDEELKKGAWWHIPLLPALKRQRQAALSEFKASLNLRTARAVTRETLSENKKTNGRRKRRKQGGRKEEEEEDSKSKPNVKTHTTHSIRLNN